MPRERDKIRQWLAMPETKAFIPELEAARRQIEVEMERFKQCGEWTTRYHSYRQFWAGLP